MSSELQKQSVTRRKPVVGFTGIGTLYADTEGNQFCLICANEDILFAKLKEFIPGEDISGARFQHVTIIAANE